MRSAKIQEKKGRVLVREDEIDSIVKAHRRLYDEAKEITEIPSAEAIEQKIQALKEAETIITGLKSGFNLGPPPPWWPQRMPLGADPYRDNLRIKAACDVLKETQDQLQLLKSPTSDRGGRRLIETIAGPGTCAVELGELFKQRTGKCHWEKVGEAVGNGFPEFLAQDDGTRDGKVTDKRLWAYRLAKRYTKSMQTIGIMAPKRLGPFLWGSMVNRDKILDRRQARAIMRPAPHEKRTHRRSAHGQPGRRQA